MKYAKEYYEVEVRVPVYVAVPDEFEDSGRVTRFIDGWCGINSWDFPVDDIDDLVKKSIPSAEAYYINFIESGGLYDERPDNALIYDLRKLAPQDDVERYFLSSELDHAFDKAAQAADIRDADALIALAKKVQELNEKLND